MRLFNGGQHMDLIRCEEIDDGTFLAEGMRVTYVAVSDGDEIHAEHVRIAG
jgi:hypothetical protein